MEDEIGGGPSEMDVLNDDSPSGGKEDEPPSSEPSGDETALLDDEADDRPDDEDSEENDEVKEEEEPEEEEEKLEAKDDLDILTNRPSYRDIQKKYPNIFKEFPDLRNMFFREGEFTKIFPSVKDAKAAFDKIEGFDELESQVLAGNAGVILDAIEDKKAIGKYAENFLPAVLERDRELYVRCTAPVLINAIKFVHSKGVETKDENLQHSAEHFSNLLFHTLDVAKLQSPSKVAKAEADPERQQFEQEKREFAQRIESSFRSAAYSSGEKAIRKEIENGLDPDKVLSEFTRKAVVQATYEELGERLQADETHMANMKYLWDRARSKNFPQELKLSIVNAYLSRARVLMPGIRRTKLNEALGKHPRTVTPKAPVRKTIPSGGAPERRNVSVKSAKDARAQGMSAMDFLKAR